LIVEEFKKSFTKDYKKLPTICFEIYTVEGSWIQKRIDEMYWNFEIPNEKNTFGCWIGILMAFVRTTLEN